jgi:hypothetical protein
MLIPAIHGGRQQTTGFMVVALTASSSIPPPPPISMPVWSLASPYGDDDDTSMNIVTFATPVSVAPPKIWAVSLYRDTKTREAFFESKIAILQLLVPELKHVVPLLGKRSGYEKGYSKRLECAKLGIEWVPTSFHQLLEGNRQVKPALVHHSQKLHMFT